MSTWPAPIPARGSVRIVSPALAPDESLLAAGVSELERQLNLRVPSASATAVLRPPRDDAARLAAVQEAFDDADAGGVLCSRGGFGTQRIAQELRIGDFVEGRRAFMGYSDATTLHTQLNRQGLATFYGPPIAWDPDNGDFPWEPVREVLMGVGPVAVEAEEDQVASFDMTTGSDVSEILLGGNLARLPRVQALRRVRCSVAPSCFSKRPMNAHRSSIGG